MAPESENPNATLPIWPLLSLLERRVLGVLVEKAKTTPDAYPMSLNALAIGSNQKSNRDPVMDLTDDILEDTLLKLQKQNLVSKIVGGRVERWRHLLYESWRADKVELAVLAELLLRGPQTEGELRGRASRMEPIDDLDALRDILRKLAERRLVVYLTPENRRGTMLTHGFHAPEELTVLRQPSMTDSPAPALPTSIPSSPAPMGASNDALESLRTDLASARTEVTELRLKVADLESAVARLSTQIVELQRSLGG